MPGFDLQNVKVSCANCSLSDLCLPAGLDKESLAKLEINVNRSKPIQKGQAIFDIGQQFNSLYTVRSGSIKLTHITEQGDEQIIGFYLPGEIFGLDAIESERHKCSAIALETMTYCFFPFNKLEDLCQIIPSLQHQIFRLMSKEIHNDNEMLLSLNNKNAEERIATFIINISKRYHSLGYSDTEFNLAMSRQDIGNYLGLTIETISRVLSRFQNENIIVANRKKIKILDKTRLHDLCIGHK